MKNFKEDLLQVKSIILDVDGVLASDKVTLLPSGEPLRSSNTKDGYAISTAVSAGLHMAIITGGKSEAIRERYGILGIEDIYMSSKNKMDDFHKILRLRDLKPMEIMYMGDDIPDYEIMLRVGMPVCPADAAPEIKAISRYVSHLKGGDGCVRDVLEQILKVQGLWMNSCAFGW